MLRYHRNKLKWQNQDVHIAISGHLPTLNVNGNYQYQDTGGLDNTNATAAQIQQLTSVRGTPLSSYSNGGIGLQLNVPIYSGGGLTLKCVKRVQIMLLHNSS